jgi:uncharacterized protein (TIGR02300 family)
MSKKATERGTKRTCQSCEARFYDLNRDPIVCPMCQAVFAVDGTGNAPAAPAVAEKPVRKPARRPEPVIEEPAGAEAVPEEVEVAEDVVLEAEDTPIEGEEETFLEQEEEDTDVSGFIEGGIEEGGEEEA